MQKHDFAEIFGMSIEEAGRLASLSREAQELGLSSEPGVGLMYLTDMPVGCTAHDVFFVIDNILYDQHAGAEPDRSPLGDQTLVPDWDSAYSWAAEKGWRLASASHEDDGIVVKLSRGSEMVTGRAQTGRVAMLEAAVRAAGA